MPHRYQLLGLLVLWLFTVSTAPAQEQLPSGRLAFSSTSFGLLVGYNQGKGTLSFQGKEYPFSMEGYKLITVGASSVDALGVVYQLDKLSDFEGRYTAAGGDFTVWQGGGGAVMKNQNGVVIYLQTLQTGLELNLGGGMDILLEQPTVEPAAGEAAKAGPVATEETKAQPAPDERSKARQGDAGSATAKPAMAKPAASE
jgi:hypothetical protein